MKKHVAYFVITSVAIGCFLTGVVVGQIMQEHQSTLWIEGMGIDQDLEVLKLIEENKDMLKQLQEFQESIEEFLGVQEKSACSS